MLQIFESNPTKYTNDFKQSINSILDQIKQGQISKSLEQAINLDYDESYLQKLNIVLDVTLFFTEMDLESIETVKPDHPVNTIIK